MLTSTVMAGMNRKTMYWREAGDCTVKAIAICLDICYAEAWYATRKHGRPYREGMDMDDILKTIQSKGKDTIPIDFIGCAVRFLEYYPMGAYIFQIKNHVIAYKDGVLHDDIHNFKGEIYSIHHIVDKMEHKDG